MEAHQEHSTEARGIAAIAALMAHPTRATILTALFDGQTRPAGELARIASVTPQTASEHLARLVAGGLLDVHTQGRHRYYRLCGPEAARAVEAVSAVAPHSLEGNRPPSVSVEMRIARTCYDHLAGRLAVAIVDALTTQSVITSDDRSFTLSTTGDAYLRSMGVDVPLALAQRRKFAPVCLDWTERRYHLAGALGAAILRRAIDAHWVVRVPQGRALRITAEGEVAFRRNLAIELS